MKMIINRLKLNLLAGGFLIIYCSIGTSLAIDVIDPGRAMAAQCSQCHGMEGNNSEGFDSLKGESFDKIYDELWDMFNSSNNELMDHQAKGYTEEDIIALANYFESQANINDSEAESI